MLSHPEQVKALCPPLPLGLGAQVAISLYEKITGNAYSAAELKNLQELKQIYTEVLRNQTPLVWNLDKDYKPTHRLSPHLWSDHIRQLNRGKHKVGHFHYQSSLIADYAASYLSERATRWVGTGSEGDLLEQFFSEWVDFAVNVLPHLDYDENALTLIRQRIHYLEKIQKHEDLFKFGFFARARNKFDTMESIKQQLYSCEALVAREALRQCAREKLDLCRSSMTGLLLSAVKVLYYGRATPVHQEPLDLQSYCGQAGVYQSAAANATYALLHNSHSGLILKELIELANFDVFGVEAAPLLALRPRLYLKRTEGAPEWNWSQKAFDLPPWIGPDQALPYLRSCQKLAESALRCAELKRLLESAYDLIGQVGEYWAYGDSEGQLSLKALTFLLEKEVDQFHQRFGQLYQGQNRQRQSYNLRYRVNPDHLLNKNFNKVDEQAEEMQRNYRVLKKAMKEVNEGLSSFNQEALMKIDSKKKLFYRRLYNYLQDYYPKESTPYSDLEAAGRSEGEGETQEADLERWSEGEADTYAFAQQSKFSQSLKADAVYLEWKKKFIERYQEDHDELIALKHRFRVAVDQPLSMEELKALALVLNDQAALLNTFAFFERPQWSLESLGWPFYPEQRQNVDYYAEDLQALREEVRACIGQESSLEVLTQEGDSTVKIYTEIELCALRVEKVSPAPSYQPPVLPRPEAKSDFVLYSPASKGVVPR